MIVPTLLLISTFFGQEITVRNNGEGPLPAGHPVSLRIDSGPAPVFITHRGKTIATRLLKREQLWFKTREIIGHGKTDSNYTLHSGTPKTPAGETVFALFEDFSGATNPFGMDGGGTFARKNERLVIHDFPEESSALSPARLRLKTTSLPQNFSLSLDLECETRKPGYAKYGIEILFRREAVPPGKLRKRIAAGVAQLGSDSWEIREGATQELIRIGAPALEQVAAALESTDAEVRWRAEHVLREIRAGGAWPGIVAGFEVDHAEIRPVAFTWRIGRTTNRMRHVPRGSIRVHIEIRRDQDGYVTLSRDGGTPTLPVKLMGEVEEIHLYGHQDVPGSSTLSVDNILLRRYLDEDARPTVTIQPRSKK